MHVLMIHVFHDFCSVYIVHWIKKTKFVFFAVGILIILDIDFIVF
jgi:hypothetical protein